jgi:ribosomal protein S12 methylthiotransferase
MILGTCKNTMELCDDPGVADLILINTCAFIESARKEAIDTILSLADYKNAKLVVCGCLPQRYKDEIINLLPEVDRFVTIDEYSNLPQIIDSVLKSDVNKYNNFSPLNRVYSTPSYMRYVKISEGCLNRCAFCAIPLIRGNLKSRTIESITEEVKMHVNDGVYEINLISQDTTKYGYDLYNKLAIVDLLKKLVEIDGDFKIRLLYLYPDIVTDELIDFIKNNPKVYPYFDIPIQHSEDKLLKAMLRRGDRAYLLELFKKIRNEIPHAIIRTTLIVGFPYEEKKDVNNLIEFMNDVRFDRLGAFTFCLEEGTPACKYPQTVKESHKQKRYEMVMEAQAKIALEKNQALIGTTLNEVFITGYDEGNFMYTARNYAYAPDDIDGIIYVAAKYELEIGKRISCRVLDCDQYSITCEQIEEGVENEN